MLALIVLAAAWPTHAEKPEKVVILGFDGADPRLVEQYMSEGLLPNLQKLKGQGSYSPILPTNPPQTPVSWSAFSTGLRPGKTQIFDFLQREAHSYAPDFALADRRKRTFLAGESNGWVVSGVIGLVAALLVLILLKIFRARWAWAFVGGLVVLIGTSVGFAGYFASLLPVEVPDAVNNRQGEPFWTTMAKSGWNVGVVRVPVTFPAEELPQGSEMISGLGVPDIRGRVGTPSLWTTDPAFTAVDNEFSLEISALPARRGVMETIVHGPFNYPFHVYPIERASAAWEEAGLSSRERRDKSREMAADLEEQGYPQSIHLPLTLTVSDSDLQWDVSGQQGTLKPGDWSDWVTLDFPINWLVDRAQPLRGMARFKLIQLEPEVQLYMSPVNFHPSSHPVPYTWPPDLADRLSEELGIFKTIGWATDTWSYPTNRLGGIDLFLEDMNYTIDGYNKILEHMLEREDLDMYVQIFYFTDRAGHMLFYNLDDQHPLFDPQEAPKFEKAMRDTYTRMDQIVGETMAKLDEDTLFIVLSDHGFTSFRRQINYNTWLYEQGLLSLKGKQNQTLDQVVGSTERKNVAELFEQDVTGVDVFSGIDWKNTKAWSMGLGAIYVNVVGRDPEGTVLPGSEYNQVVDQIKTGLEALTDTKFGVNPIFKVYTRDEMYGQDYDPDRMPDLRAANILTYRVSWQDSLGGLSTQIFEDNPRTWSGDHCSLEPTELRGVLFINRKLTVEQPEVIDMAPSILNELGVPPATQLDGQVVWEPAG